MSTSALSGVERAPFVRLPSLGAVAHRAVLTSLLACYVIGPMLPAFGAAGDVIGLVSVGLVAYAMLRGAIGAPLQLPTRSLPLAAYTLLALAVYSTLIVVLNGGEDPYYFVRSIRVLLHFAGGVVLATLYVERYGVDVAGPLLRDIFWILTAHAALILAEFVVPPVRMAVYAFTKPPLHPSNLAYRMAGLTNGAGAGTSVIQLIPLLIMPVLWTRARYTATLMALIVAACLNVVGFILTGRTGLLLAGVVMPPLLLAWRRIGAGDARVARRGMSRVAQGAIAVAASISIVSAAYGLLLRKIAASSLGLFLARATYRTFDTFLNLQSTGSFRSETVDNLVESHLIWPDSPLVMLFGNSLTDRAHLDSDIGYVRFVFGLGIVGTLLQVVFYLQLIRDAWVRRRAEPGLALPAIALSVCLLLANAKEPFLLVRYYFSVTVLLHVAHLHVAARRATVGATSPA